VGYSQVSWFFGCCLVSFAVSILVGSLFSRFCLGGYFLGFFSGFSGQLWFSYVYFPCT
jgi:hypothetical protein